MKTSKKLFSLIFAIVLIASLSLAVHAVKSDTENPVSIVVETDKNSYSYTKIATFNVTVTNSGDTVIKDVTAQVVFDKLSPVAKGSNTHKKEAKELKPGESLSFSYKATLHPDKNKLNFFQKIIMWFVQFFNSGYDVSTERINDGRNVTEHITEINFGKNRPINIIEVAYNMDAIPESPDEPEVPDVPDEPDTPDIPDEPDIPDDGTPEKVTGITITELGSAYVSLMWKPSKNADSYLLLIRPKGTSVWTSKVTTHNAFTFSGLSSETAYEIIIYASNNGVLSEKSNTVIVMTDIGFEEPTTAPSEEEITTEIPEDTTYWPTEPTEEETTYWPWWEEETTTEAPSEEVTTEYWPWEEETTEPPAEEETTTEAPSEEETTTEPTTQPYFSVSVNNSYSCYVNESIKIEPVFTPSNTPDKSFTLEGKDYTYSYKAGLFGSQTKTDTCKFEDYFFIDNKNGILLAKKATIEPKTNNAFTFTVTLTAANGKTTTFKVSAIAKLISIYYAGEDSPWYYGNSAKLSADIDSNAGFRADSLKWSSSNTKVATVSSDGMVNCVGTGEVTITATAPVGTKSHSITFYVKEVLNLSKDYFENCVIGKNYKLEAYTKPSGNTDNILYLSSDPDVATVDDNGMVTFKKNGFVRIYISAPNSIDTVAVLTTDPCTLPSGTKAELLSILVNSANKIKTQMPALYHSSLPTFTNVRIHKEGNFKTEDLVGIFESFASSKSRYIPAVTFNNYPNQTEYDNAYNNYMASVPVSGAHYLVIPGLQENEIKSIEVVDKGSYTYDIKLTLNDEYMATPPAKPSDTAHGKIFDILANDYLVKIKAGLEDSGSGMSLKYTAFEQTYNNSTLSVTYDKVTGKITNLNYDMNVHVEIVDLKLSMTLITAIDSTVTFDVNNNINYEVISK